MPINRLVSFYSFPHVTNLSSLPRALSKEHTDKNTFLVLLASTSHTVALCSF